MYGYVYLRTLEQRLQRATLTHEFVHVARVDAGQTQQKIINIWIVFQLLTAGAGLIAAHSGGLLRIRLWFAQLQLFKELRRRIRTG